MQFLTTTDFNGIIGTSSLNSLRGALDVNLTEAEKLAISELSPLRGNYDVDYELALAGTSRNVEVIRILIHIAAYYLYNTVEDVEIPERIDNNYNNQVKLIAKIADGSIYTTIKPLLNDDATPKSNYRFGGDASRDNEIF